MLHQIYLSRRGRPDHQLAPGWQSSTSRTRTGPPGGPAPPRHVEEDPVCRHGAAIWAALCAKVFSAVADGLMWIMHSNGALPSLHYLLLLGRPAKHDCGKALRTTLPLCEELGVPVAPEKTEGTKVYTNLSGHRD